MIAPSAGEARLIAFWVLCGWPMLLHLEHLPRVDPVVMPAFALWAYLGWPVACAGLVWGRRPAASALWLVGGALATGSWLATDTLKAHSAAWLAGGVVAVLLAFAGAKRAGLSAADLGLSAGAWRWWARYTALACGVAALLVVVGSRLSPQLLAFYPVYRPARSDLGQLLAFELGMFVHLACWEAFFRGVLLQMSRRATTDAVAVLLQAVPFFLLHAGKPDLELASSLVGGLVAGVACLAARSCWPAALVHGAMYASMDLVGFAARQPG